MKSKFSRRLFLLFLVVALVTISIPANTTAQAQGYCALTQEQCDLFDSALNEQANITSMNIESMNVSLVGQADEQALGMTVTNMAGPIAYYRNQLDFDAAWTIETVTVHTPDSTGSVDLNGLEIRVVDDNLYFYNPLENKWEGDELDMSGFAALLAGSSGSMTNSEFLISPSNAVWSEDMVTWTAEDSELNGTPVVKFTADIRLGDAASNRDFMLVVGEAIGIISDGDITAELFQFIMGGVAIQIEDELNEGAFQVVYSISPNDNLVYGVDFIVEASLDLTFLQGLIDDLDVDTISFNLAVDAAISEHNATFEITPPEID